MIDARPRWREVMFDRYTQWRTGLPLLASGAMIMIEGTAIALAGAVAMVAFFLPCIIAHRILGEAAGAIFLAIYLMFWLSCGVASENKRRRKRAA